MILFTHYLAKNWKAADEYAVALSALKPASPRLLMLHARILNARGKRQEMCEAIAKAVSLRPDIIPWRLRLAQTQERVGRWSAAAESYSRLIAQVGDRAEWHYSRAYAFERAGQDAEAAEAYDRLRAVAAGPEMLELGIGALHQNHGRWEAAIRAYEALVHEQGLDVAPSKLIYSLGLAYDRSYEFEKAQEFFELACARPDRDINWLNRLGYIYETLSLWREAEAVYAQKIQYATESDLRFCLYRRAYCLSKLEDWAAAQRVIELDPDWVAAKPVVYGNGIDERRELDLDSEMAGDWSDVTRLDTIARRFEEQGDWSHAEQALDELIQRHNSHNASHYFRRSHALLRLGRLDEACNVYLSSRPIRRNEGLNLSRYWNNSQFRRRANFIEFSERSSVLPNVILYECFHGINMTCNPWGMYVEALRDPRFSGYTHVWVINDFARIPDEARRHRSTIFVKRHSDLYIYYLARAEYLVNNTSFPDYYSRRPEQKYLNTWHGTPIKYLGKQMKTRVLDWRNITRNFLHCTHILSPNAHTSRALIDDYDIRDAFSGQFVEAGYPRIDRTLNLKDQERAQLRRELGVVEGQKIVLYMPTFRGDMSGASHDVRSVFKDIRALNKLSAKLLFRGHHLAESHLSESKLKHHIVPATVNTNELIALADVLITDYSSVAVDFLPTMRPTVYYLHDIDAYREERGLYFDPAELPGYVAHNRDELIRQTAYALENGVGDRDAHARAVETYCPNETGQAASAVLDWFLLDDACGVKLIDTGEREVMLLYGGSFIPNGITSSFRNLSSRLDTDQYSVKLALDPKSIWNHEERKNQFEFIPSTFGLWGRLGPENMQCEEAWAVRRYRGAASKVNERFVHIYRVVYRREARRVFGAARIHYMIDFEGFNTYWASILSSAEPSELKRKLIYQHNDVYSEWKTRFSWFDAIARMYSGFDALVSVSRTIRDLNFKQIAPLFNLEEVAHVYCPNGIDSKKIRSDALKNSFTDDEELFFRRHSPVFISIGRLSEAKDFTKLIDAFSEIRRADEQSEAGLIIVGSGPLRARLEDQIKQLELCDDVLLCGQKENPFPYLRRSDCFVMSSLYEGQPMVLLESLALSVPVVTTRFDSVHDVISADNGLIVDNSVDGLVYGMREYVVGAVPRPKFDAAKYEQEAVERFYDLVVRGEFDNPGPCARE